MAWLILFLISIPIARFSPPLAMGLLVLSGWLCLSSWAKHLAAAKSPLRHILLGSYALQIAVTGLFFMASWQSWPLWGSQQLGSGFWQFAIDAPAYHLNAIRIMDAFRLHQPLPGNIAAPEFAAFIALIYALWGIQPLLVCFLNAWIRGVAVIFAYLLGRRLLDERAGCRAAILVGFWPSLFIWSSQLLRETACLAVLLGVLYGLAALWRFSEKPSGTGSRARLALEVAAGILLLTQVRWYLALILWVTALAVCALAFIQRVLLRRHGFGDATLVFAVVMLAFGVGRFQDPMRWLPLLMPAASQQRALSPDQLAEKRADGLLSSREVAHLENQSLSMRSNPRPEVRQLWVQLKGAMGKTDAPQEAAAPAGQAASAQELTQPSSPDQHHFEWGNVGPKFGDWRAWRLINWITAGAAKNLYATRWASLERAHTVVAPKADTSTMAGTVRFLPYGILSAILAPWPTQWFDRGGFTGIFKSWSSVEALFIYALFVSMVLGALRTIAHLRPERFGILLFALLGLAFLALTVATVGTLFRLRLNFLIPLAILGCTVESPPGWLAGWLWYNWRLPFPRKGFGPDTNRKARLAEPPIRVLRIMTRMNVGGPAVHVSLLSKGLDSQRFPTCVVIGQPDAGEGDLSGLLRDTPVKTVRLPMLHRRLDLGNDFKTFVRLVRLAWSEQPRIIHTHMAKAGTLGRLAGFCYNWAGPGKCQEKRAILVHTFHGHVLEGYFSSGLSKFFVSIERWLARRTDCLIAVSGKVRDELLELGIGRPDRWKVVPLGLDLSSLGQLPLPENDRPLRVGMVGRLSMIKNPQLFLEAIGRIANRTSADIRGIMVGDGPLRRDLESQARRLGLGDIVTFTGWQQDLANVYANLEVTCITSWNEGTPVSMIETMAAGRTVIATDVGGVRDVLEGCPNSSDPIREGSFRLAERGILIRPGDVEGLTGALTAVMNDPLLRQKLGTAARRYVLESYQAQRLFKDITALYEELNARSGE